MSNDEMNAEINQEVETPKKRVSSKKTTDGSQYANESETERAVSSDSVVELGVYRIDESNDFELKFQTDDAACFDLAAFFKVGERVKVYKTNDVVHERKVIDSGLIIHTGERALIPTGLIFDIPQGYCLELYARSGTSLKLGLVLNNAPAQIDSDYVNECFISIANTGLEKFIQSGERIAQAKLVRLVPTAIKPLTEAPKQKTNRVGGIGSTGK